MPEDLIGNDNTTADENTTATNTEPIPENTEPVEGSQDATPVVPEAYDFSSFIGEGEQLDEEGAKAFSDVLKGLNIDQKGAEVLTQYGLEYMETVGNRILDEVNKAQDAQAEAWKQEAVTTLGQEFDNTVSLAGAGIEYLEKEIPNLREVLSINGIGNNVALIKAFAKLGSLVAEDTGKLGTDDVSQGRNSFYDNTDFNRYKR